MQAVKAETAWSESRAGGLSPDRTSLSSPVMGITIAPGHRIIVRFGRSNVCDSPDPANACST